MSYRKTGFLTILITSWFEVIDKNVIVSRPRIAIGAKYFRVVRVARAVAVWKKLQSSRNPNGTALHHHFMSSFPFLPPPSSIFFLPLPLCLCVPFVTSLRQSNIGQTVLRGLSHVTAFVQQDECRYDLVSSRVLL